MYQVVALVVVLCLTGGQCQSTQKPLTFEQGHQYCVETKHAVDRVYQLQSSVNELTHIVRKLLVVALADPCRTWNNEVSCYKFNTEHLTWPNAKSACLTGEGHLVALENQAENDFIQQTLRSNSAYNNHNWWTSGYKIENNKKWVWDGIHVDTDIAPERWFTNEPNNKGKSEKCAEMKMLFDFKLNDQHCNSTNAFICEYTFKRP
ncbi:hypothetical protein CAPTEDRAFT_200131 [Capitella teleta]|uniref:C-type lectin domain-containing protein n=1 Tax=Capitella teleta TaxID=283909 RepID=R7V2I8_CAPTE|nr:hypothetical protein CAPTEDRAFT_200131 [Capitella teleta]|eukprot:ELU13073.1 hypothetical protein CAPTEDRAFT_200131 [Capitella teleta]